MQDTSTLSILKVSDMDASKVSFNGQGVQASCAANSASNVDYTLADDAFLTGGTVRAVGANVADHATLQVVDTSGAFTGTPGTVLRQFVTNYYMRSDQQDQFDIDEPYTARIPAGLTVRIIYTNTGSNPVTVSANYKLHKILS